MLEELEYTHASRRSPAVVAWPNDGDRLNAAAPADTSRTDGSGSR